MKKLILSATVAFTVLTTSNIYAQQGFGTNTPDRSSAVDIVSSKRGLLIPRIDIPNLDQAAPVSNPANALMVYNTGKTTAAGFYYWDASYNNGAGRWVRFVSSNSGSAVTVSAGTNVMVTPTSDGRDTDYNVSVKGGKTTGQVLVTKIETGSDGTPVQTTEWVKPQDFINGSVEGINGITTTTTKEGKVQVGLGGSLTEKTVLNTGKDKELAITGLEKLDGTTGKEFDAKTQNIVVMGADGILKQVTPEALLEDAIKGGTVDGKALTSKGNSIQIDGDAAKTALLKDVNIEVKGGTAAGQVLITKEIKDAAGTVTGTSTEWVTPGSLGNTVTASNGLTKDIANDITLGGSLTKPTTITTDDKNTLAIDGLTSVEKKDLVGNNVVIADDKGVLKQTSAKNLIEDAIEKGTDDTDPLKAKTLKGDGITVTATGATTGVTDNVANSLLKDVTLGIADGAVKNSKIYAGAVTSDKMKATVSDANGGSKNAEAGMVPVANADGTVTYQQVSGETLKGKELKSSSIKVSGGKKALLDETTIEIAGGTSVGQVLVTKEGPVENNVQTYITEWVTPESLGNTVTASNGLTKTDNNITLGGTITNNTVLDIAAATTGENATPAGSLSIKGLNSPSNKKEVVKNVVVGADGKMYAVTNADKTGSITINKAGDVNIGGDINYSVNQEEVVIEVTLGATDTNLKLPTPSGVEGQTISVKIANTNEDHNGYLNIVQENDTLSNRLAYGAMPFQGWIIKSNGTKWIVVGRN